MRSAFVANCKRRLNNPGQQKCLITTPDQEAAAMRVHSQELADFDRDIQI